MDDHLADNSKDADPGKPETRQGLSRREFLLRGIRTGAGAAVGAALMTGGLAALTGLGRKGDTTELTPVATGAALASGPDGRPLGVHAAAKGLLYGAATVLEYLAEDADFASHFAEECSLLVPETELKWAALRPSKDQFDF